MKELKNPIISIIVPIYNVDKYLRQCLNSIRHQTFKDWECILVDDGSTDKSPAICDEYANIDSRFKVIHKENGGVSSARNVGLANSTGNYIGFVDPDDWTEPELFEKLYNLITTYNAEVSQVGFLKEYRNRHSTKRLTNKTKVISGDSALREICYDRMPNYLWNKLHNRNIINCKFPEGHTFEDIYVYGKWLKNVNRMVIDPTPLYHYRMRKGSIVHADVVKNRYDYFMSCIYSMSMVEGIEINNDVNTRYAYINKTAVIAAKKISRQENDKQKRLNAIKKICNVLKKYPLPSCKYFNIKIWWRALILRQNPSLFSKLMRTVYVLDFSTKQKNNQLYD